MSVIVAELGQHDAIIRYVKQVSGGSMLYIYVRKGSTWEQYGNAHATSADITYKPQYTLEIMELTR
jgi:hypothetical protein